jgi:ribose transport system permease protein
VGGNIEAARLSGIDTDRVRVWVYTISGLMAGIAGLTLMGRVNAAYPLAGLSYEMDAIAAVIIGGGSFMGGVGNIWGTLIGAIMIAVIRNGLNLLGVSPDAQTIVIGLVIIGAVYVDVLRRRRRTA